MDLLNRDRKIDVSGVYIITNRINNKRYVGSSTNCLRRYKEHSKQLELGKHPNRHLQSGFYKHGSEAFLFEMIETVCEEKLLKVEQQYIEVLCCTDPKYGYNLSALAGKVEWTAERRLKVSLANKGKSKPTLKGKKRSSEICEKISATKKASGYRHSEETKAKQRTAFSQNREKRLVQLSKVWEGRRAANSH